MASDAAVGGDVAKKTSRGVRFGDDGENGGGGESQEGVTFVNFPAETGVQISTQFLRQVAFEIEKGAPRYSADKMQRMKDVQVEIYDLCNKCVAELGHSEQATQLLPVGAYPLGVTMRGLCLDLVYVAPVEVQLVELHAAMHAKLFKEGVSRCSTAPPDGPLAAPGLKFEYNCVSITLLFSQRVQGIPQPSTNGVISNVAGLVAWEVSDRLLGKVPNVCNFRMFLRFIRLWAQRRSIYGGYFGFVKGTSWAIACARICQMHPNLEVPGLLLQFFRVYSRWDWRVPLSLLTNTPMDGAGDAAASEGRASRMHFIAPVGTGIVFQEVGETITKITSKELRRGYKIVLQIEQNRASWSDLITEPQFAHRHRHFLQLDFMANNEIFDQWFTWAHEQLVKFMPTFEASRSATVTLRPWPEVWDFKDPEWPNGRAVFVGLNLEHGTGATAVMDSSGNNASNGGRAPRTFDLREPTIRFLEALAEWPEASKHTNQFEFLLRHVRAADLENWMEKRKKSFETKDTEYSDQGIGDRETF
eukprot:TRINITY_DN6129_c0_g3_i1.p1 TRINITY_DN6129_c0_g3~~TRINITY_DN6129_c0_g3_i1.p1  ORF type:complete len:530 (+),score=94.13 TRINITY_DN6129_c0_g3_i1:106-1695(+)